MQGFESGLQGSKAVDELVEMVWIGSGLLRPHGQLNLLLLSQHLRRFAKGLE